MSHPSFSVFRSLLFLDLGNYFASFSIEALDLNPASIGRRKRKGCFWTFHDFHKDEELNSWVGQAHQ